LFFLTNLQMVHQRTLHGAMSLNIGWSVCVEEQFYLIWPLLFLLVRPRHYAFIFLSIVGVSALFRFVHFDEPLVLKFHTLSVISDMAIGGLAAYLMATSSRAVEAAIRWPRSVILLGYGLGLPVVLACVHSTAGSITWAVLGRLLCTLFFAFVIVEQSYGEHSFVKARRFRKLSEMGKYSYGLYLIHPIAITLVLDLSRLHRGPAGSFEGLFLIGLAALGLTIALSSLSYRLYERRFLMLKQRFAHIQSGG
jgi:peptidoglycan/LPS O-acetylase OafA/YrhL